MPSRADVNQLIDHLRLIPYFKGLDDSTLRDLARDAVWKDYAAGEVIFFEGDPSGSVPVTWESIQRYLH